MSIESDLSALADPERAEGLQRFFKTGVGEYGEGDVFIGLTVPQQRAVAKRHLDASPAELERLLASEIHEHRLTALVILSEQFRRADTARRDEIAGFYLDRRDRVNNWDLVDASARIILADRVRRAPRKLLDPLLRSESVWDRRIAVLATFSLIREDEFGETLRCAEELMGDGHDLIQKALGWMLREVGKRDEAALRAFLDEHAAVMPRTMLRYSLERLPEADRQRYMAAATVGG